MKYNFVFDKDFLGNKTLCLSNMERFIVLAAVVGGHNVSLSGYHTERIVSAIKLLQDNNTPFVSVDYIIDSRKLIGKNTDIGVKQGLVTDADGGVLHFSNLDLQDTSVTAWLQTVMTNGWIKLSNNGEVRTLPAKFQLIAENDIKGITKDYCDIRFRCNEYEPRQLSSLAVLQRQVTITKEFQSSRGRGDFKNCNIEIIDALKPSSNAVRMISEQSIGIDTLCLARTIADIYGHNIIFCSDIEKAKCLQNISEYSL